MKDEDIHWLASSEGIYNINLWNYGTALKTLNYLFCTMICDLRARSSNTLVSAHASLCLQQYTYQYLIRCFDVYCRCIFSKLIIHLKKLLGSDWLKRSAFLVNTVQKRVTQCRKVKHECKLQRRYPKLKRRLLEANRCISKTAEDRAKPSKDFRRPYEAFRRPHETFRRFPKITRTLPNVSEDHPNTSEVFRRLPEYFRRSFEHFRRLTTISGDLRRSPDIFEPFPSFRRSKAIPSVYLSSKCMVRGLKLSIFSSVLLISNHMIFLVQFGINKHL